MSLSSFNGPNISKQSPCKSQNGFILTDFLCLCILHKLLSLFYLCSLFYADLILGFNVCFTPSKRVRPLLNSCGYWWNKIMGLTHKQVHSPVWWSREQIAANRGGYQSVRKIHCNWFWGQIGMNLRIFILKKKIYIYIYFFFFLFFNDTKSALLRRLSQVRHSDQGRVVQSWVKITQG